MIKDCIGKSYYRPILGFTTQRMRADLIEVFTILKGLEEGFEEGQIYCIG